MYTHTCAATHMCSHTHFRSESESLRAFFKKIRVFYVSERYECSLFHVQNLLWRFRNIIEDIENHHFFALFSLHRSVVGWRMVYMKMNSWKNSQGVFLMLMWSFLKLTIVLIVKGFFFDFHKRKQMLSNFLKIKFFSLIWLSNIVLNINLTNSLIRKNVSIVDLFEKRW